MSRELESVRPVSGNLFEETTNSRERCACAGMSPGLIMSKFFKKERHFFNFIIF